MFGHLHKISTISVFQILELFNNATLDEVREWMKPTVFAATLERLNEIEKSYGISEEKQKQRVKIAKILANATLNDSIAEYIDIAKYCSQVEMIYIMKVHLMHLFQNAVSCIFTKKSTKNKT